jgi:uncharacterized protein (TIGR03437 family)
VLLGPSVLPLEYVSDGQVNALIPFNLPPNSIQQLLVKRGTTQSVAVNVTLAEFEPGIFTLNRQGTGQGAIFNGVTNVLADATHPVKAGKDVITIYCTGLGAVSNPPPPGAPAPSAPNLSITLATPTVTIGGISAKVEYSGLAPTFVGLYQVNAEVPQGVEPGSSVPVVISFGTASSNTATIAVK